MSKKSKRLEAEHKKLAIKKREQSYCFDPENALEDVVWKYAPGQNGSPVPKAECGSRHRGPCCCTDTGCCR